MKRFSTMLSASGLAISLLAAGSAAQATMFDFGATAVGNEQGNPAEVDSTPVGLRFDGTGSVFTNGFTGSGLQVIATGQYNGAGQDGTLDNSPFAYLDGLDGGRQAGLGVCGSLNGNQCKPNDDDNVTGSTSNPTTADEQLTLTTDRDVRWSDLSFKQEGHVPVDVDNTLLVNGISTTFGDAQNLMTEFGDTLTFGYGGTNAEQFYLSGATATAAVPAPAGLGLFGLALVGVGAFCRRHRLIG